MASPDRDCDNHDLPAIEVLRERSAEGYTKEKILIYDLGAARSYLERGDMHPIDRAKSLFLVIIIGTFLIGVVFVVAGVALVYLGASGTIEINLLGQSMSSTNVGIGSIFIGGVIILVVIRSAMKHINDILRR